MKLLLDMNLSPTLAELLAQHGFTAVHWTTVGLPTALLPKKTGCLTAFNY